MMIKIDRLSIERKKENIKIKFELKVYDLKSLNVSFRKTVSNSSAALNSKRVLDETTEEGRLVNTGTVLGMNAFISRASLHRECI